MTVSLIFFWTYCIHISCLYYNSIFFSFFFLTQYVEESRCNIPVSNHSFLLLLKWLYLRVCVCVLQSLRSLLAVSSCWERSTYTWASRAIRADAYSDCSRRAIAINTLRMKVQGCFWSGHSLYETETETILIKQKDNVSATFTGMALDRSYALQLNSDAAVQYGTDRQVWRSRGGWAQMVQLLHPWFFFVCVHVRWRNSMLKSLIQQESIYSNAKIVHSHQLRQHY